MALYTSIKGPVTYTTVGEVTVENGIASNFSNNKNYLSLNANTIFGSQDFEFSFRINTPETWNSNHNAIFADGAIYMFKNKDNGRLSCYYRANYSGGWSVKLSGPVLETSHTYDVGLKRSNNRIVLICDGIEYDYNTTPIVFSQQQGRIGVFRSGGDYFGGSIDLNYSYIRMGELAWFGKCQSRVKVNSGLARYTVVGSPTLIDDKLTGLESNYIQLNTPITFTGNKVEFTTKVRVKGNNVNGRLLWSSAYAWLVYKDHWSAPSISVAEGKAGSGDLGPANSTVDSYFRVIFYNGLVNTYISSDGVNWIHKSVDKSYSPTNNVYLRLGGYSNGWEDGYIDLKETYIKLNDSYFWRGSDYYQNLDSYKVHQDNFSKYYTIVDGKLTWANPNIKLIHKAGISQYLQTNYIPNTNTVVQAIFSFDEEPVATTNQRHPIVQMPGGHYNNQNYPDQFTYHWWHNSSSGYASWFYVGSSGGAQTYTLDMKPLHKYKVIVSGDSSISQQLIDISTNTVLNKTNTTYNFDGSNKSNMRIFGDNTTNTIDYSIHQVNIIEDGVSLNHFVPVPKGLLIGNFVVPSNGMFDIVTQTFYGNAGTGEFEIGGIPDDYIIEGGKMIWCNPNISLENNSNWSAYINTGIIPTNDMRFRVIAQLTDVTNTYDGCLFGSRTNSSASGKQFEVWNFRTDGKIGSFVYGTGWNGNYTGTAGEKYTFEYDGTTYTVNGTTPSTGVWIGDKNINSTLPIFLYGLNQNGSLESRRFRGRVFSSVFWSGSTILQYLVPVPKGILIGDKIASSNCMFDLVTQTFFENKGTGEFTIGGLSGDYIFVGNDVVWGNPNIYLRAKGTNNGGPQYIDTGLKLSNTSRVKVDFQFNVNSSWIFAADNNDDGYPRFGFIYSSGVNFAPVWYGAARVYGVGTSRFDKNTIDFNKTNVTLNKTEKTYAAFTDRDFTTIQTCYLFANHKRDGSINQSAQYDAQIYNCEMYNNNKLMRYFIPVTTNMQISGTTIPAPGMWDMVTKKFFPNKGTGSFTYGKDS